MGVGKKRGEGVYIEISEGTRVRRNDVEMRKNLCVILQSPLTMQHDSRTT